MPLLGVMLLSFQGIIGRVTVMPGGPPGVWRAPPEVGAGGPRLASIAANDSTVAVCASHMCADGMFFHSLLRGMAGGARAATLSPALLRSTESIFERELADPGLSTAAHVRDVERLTVVPWSDRPGGPPPRDGMSRHMFWQFGIDELQCFRDGSRGGLTEALWAAVVVAFSGFAGSLDRVGCSTCVNLRQIMRPQDVDMTIGNNWGPVCVVAEGFRPEMTLREVGALMRQDFERKKASGGFLAAVKASLHGIVFPKGRNAYVELSSIGRMDVREPIVDVWIQETMTSRSMERMLSVLAWTTAGDGPERIVIKGMYAPTVMSTRDAEVLFKSLVHVLKNAPMEAPAKTVFDEVVAFRKGMMRADAARGV